MSVSLTSSCLWEVTHQNAVEASTTAAQSKDHQQEKEAFTDPERSQKTGWSIFIDCRFFQPWWMNGETAATHQPWQSVNI